MTAVMAFAALDRASGAQDAPVVAAPAGEVPEPPTVLETAFDRARRVAVPVFLNGRGPFEFVVDTGSNRSVIAAEVAEACGLPVEGTEPVHGILGVELTPMVRVSRIRAGGIVSADQRLPRVTRARVGADGILGLDLLRGRRILLNFRNQSFQIEQSGSGSSVISGMNGASRLAAPGRPISVPARYRSGQLVIIDAHAVGKPVTAFLDSGSQVTVANRALQAEALRGRPDLVQQLIHSRLISATGQQAPAEFGPLPGLKIGRFGIDTPFVAYADLHIFDLWDLQTRPTVLIGVDVLRRFDQVAFDFPRKLITFWPPRGGPAGEHE